MAKLRIVLQMLIDGNPLPSRLNDHLLKGAWKGWRDLHIEPTGCCSTRPLPGMSASNEPALMLICSGNK